MPPAHPKVMRLPVKLVLKVTERLRSGMPLKTLIVDDEPSAGRGLGEGLESIAGVEIVGEADNGAVALDKIAEYRPDLVLLDLQMPAMGVLDVVRNIRSGTHMPVIVIVTAYDKYAVQGFEGGAIDYLLKPVGQERLGEAIERAKRVSGREAVEKLAHLQEIGDPREAPLSRKIVGKVGEEYFLLSADEIFAFQADGDIVWIVTAKKRYMATQTLKVLEQRLRNTSFRRSHRHPLRTVDHVRKMSALSSQRWLITMSNDQEFVASKRQARSVRQLLNGWT